MLHRTTATLFHSFAITLLSIVSVVGAQPPTKDQEHMLAFVQAVQKLQDRVLHLENERRETVAAAASKGDATNAGLRIRELDSQIAELQQKQRVLEAMLAGKGDSQITSLVVKIDSLRSEVERSRATQEELRSLREKMASLEQDLNSKMQSESKVNGNHERLPNGVLTGREGSVNASLSKLRGVWRRVQGGYVIEVNDIRPPEHGGISAAYFSQDLQRFVHVQKATATPNHNGRINFVVELWDEGYYGSNYRLVFDSRTDQLTGTYRSMDGRTLNVEFQRE